MIRVKGKYVSAGVKLIIYPTYIEIYGITEATTPKNTITYDSSKGVLIRQTARAKTGYLKYVNGALIMIARPGTLYRVFKVPGARVADYMIG